MQARMGSQRLPGKVLLPLGSRTVLGHVLQRTLAAACLDEVVVATSESPRDDAIEAQAGAYGVGTYRGSEHDVLARYAGAARAEAADAVVRITADCPLLDPQIVEAMVRDFLQTPCDYLSNGLQNTFPRGLDVEIMTSAALHLADRTTASAYDREHVTPFLYDADNHFAVRNFARAGGDESRQSWTLDTAADYAFLQAFFQAYPQAEDDYSSDRAIAFLASRPDLVCRTGHAGLRA